MDALEAVVHELTLRLLEPTIVVTKAVVDLGVVRESGLGPPESLRARIANE